MITFDGKTDWSFGGFLYDFLAEDFAVILYFLLLLLMSILIIATLDQLVRLKRFQIKL